MKTVFTAQKRNLLKELVPLASMVSGRSSSLQLGSQGHLGKTKSRPSGVSFGKESKRSVFHEEVIFQEKYDRIKRKLKKEGNACFHF